MNTIDLENHPVVPAAEWLAARRQLLAREKELTRQRDELARQRRELPWVKVDKTYTFAGAQGKVTLADLFANRSQLIIYHFMLGPDWEAGCPGCSFISDHVDAARQHFEHADISFAAVSSGPLEKLTAYKKRMGWTFTWVSSAGSDFNYDFHVTATKEDQAKGEMFYNFTTEKIDADTDEMHGTSVFYKNAKGEIFHTYSTYARGGEEFLGAYRYIDITPKGRTIETGPMSWMKRHDEYEK